MNHNHPIGTVISDESTPTFETIRIQLDAGKDISPGALIKIPVERTEKSILIARVRSGYEHNPSEGPEFAKVRKTLKMSKSYPKEEDSTKMFRLFEADLIEEIIGQEIRSPQNLPNSGADVFLASEDEIILALGIKKSKGMGLYLGETVGGLKTSIILDRAAIQRHFFICGTTGSGKSYAMGVVAEELIKHKLPVIFIDTQDEYSDFVIKKGGQVVEPGINFHIRISSLTESELIDLLPEAMKKSDLQCDIVSKVFGELQTDLANQTISKFRLNDIISRVPDVASQLTAKTSEIPRVIDTVTRRLTSSINGYRIFGSGVADWRKLMYPCLSINCKNLNSKQLQSTATAVLRELQNLRLHGHIPPYVAVIDEAHLFVPEREGSPCKQIIREGVRIGRHHGIAMILMTQSPVDIDKSIIRQCNTRLVFALEPDQLDAIKGVKADASDEMLRSLPKMPRGTCLISGTYESLKHTIPVKIRKRRTKNAEGGKTPNIFKEMKDSWIPTINQLKQP